MAALARDDGSDHVADVPLFPSERSHPPAERAESDLGRDRDVLWAFAHCLTKVPVGTPAGRLIRSRDS
jgi:hypothetical protein